VGRAKAFEAVVKGAPIPQASVPESFNVLVNELKALGLNIIPQGVIERPEDLEIEEGSKMAKEIEELAEASGASLEVETKEETPEAEPIPEDEAVQDLFEEEEEK